MSEPTRNENGVPQYPRGHAGRLLVAAAAVATLERPTATTVANLTGLEKGNIDRMVMSDLKSQFGVVVDKTGPVFQIQDWGKILKPAGVKECLTVLIDRTTMEAMKK
jgi:hypothetical protein